MSALVEAYARDVQLPKKHRRGRQERRRCIYCGLVVGEAVWIKGNREYERYVKTDVGPVCESCYDDPSAEVRAGRNEMRTTKRAVFRLQIRSFPLSVADRQARDVEIVRMHDEGMTYAQIAPLVGMSKQGAASAARRMRAQMAGDNRA